MILQNIASGSRILTSEKEKSNPVRPKFISPAIDSIQVFMIQLLILFQAILFSVIFFYITVRLLDRFWTKIFEKKNSYFIMDIHTDAEIGLNGQKNASCD
jgi:hypothetical protein